jgi:hypothetical protein
MQPLLVSAGLSLIEAKGARKKYAVTLRAIHTAYTGFPQGNISLTLPGATTFLRENLEIFPRTVQQAA